MPDENKVVINTIFEHETAPRARVGQYSLVGDRNEFGVQDLQRPENVVRNVQVREAGFCWISRRRRPRMIVDPELPSWI